VHCGHPLSWQVAGKTGDAIRLVSALWLALTVFGLLAASRTLGGGIAMVLGFLSWVGLLVAFYVTRNLSARPIYGATKESGA